jgi:hypothetical protein
LHPGDADEAEATATREHIRAFGLTPLTADDRVGPILGAAERVLATRRSAVMERRQPPRGSEDSGVRGDLYLTSTRLLLVGHQVVDVPLTSIDEMVVASERLLLSLGNGSGMRLAMDRPRVFRVEAANARAAARHGGRRR